MSILAPISAGELVDKITILRVKAQRIGDPLRRVTFGRISLWSTTSWPEAAAASRSSAALIRERSAAGARPCGISVRKAVRRLSRSASRARHSAQCSRCPSMAAADGVMVGAQINMDLVEKDPARAVARYPFTPELEQQVCEQVLGDRRHGLDGSA